VEKIIFIRGPICSGKSTIARILFDNLENASLIDQDTLKNDIDNKYSSKWRRVIAFETSVFLINKLMERKRTIIVEIHSSRKKQYLTYIKIAKKNNYDIYSFLLYPPLKICLNRNKSRPRFGMKYNISRKQIRRYWKNIYKIKNEKVFDTSKKSVKEICLEIIKDIRL